ncbi:MAG: AAA family ATPase [Desulfurivibrionaceae bacterium]
MPPDIFIFMGFIASGKSTLARAFSEKRGLPYYNSDVVRKKIAGLQAESRAGDEFGKGIYSQEYTRKTYDGLLDYAAAELQAGSSVVLDASYSRRRERKYAVDLAARFGAGCCFIFCQCSEETTQKGWLPGQGTGRRYRMPTTGFIRNRKSLLNILISLKKN